MGRITQNRDGEIRSGLFFVFQSLVDDTKWPLKSAADSLAVPRAPTDEELQKKGDLYAWLDFAPDEDDEVREFTCDADGKHITRTYYRKVSADLNGGSAVAPLLAIAGHDGCGLSLDMKERLEKVRVRGARIDPVTINVNQSRVKNPKIWALQFVGRAKPRLPKFVDVPNACPHCGKSKIVCETCGDWPMICKACGEQMAVIETDHKGKDDKRVPFHPQLWHLIDGSSWDGSDLFKARQWAIASKRFIDWLLRVHAAPFYAEPVWFAADGMSDEQKGWLKELEKPLEA